MVEKSVSAYLPAGRSDGDPKGASFGILLAKQKKATKNSITIGWKRVAGASSYVIYGNACGSPYQYLANETGTTYKQTGLKKGKYYKYTVFAVKADGTVIASSKTLHIATSGGKVGNNTKVKLNKSKVTMKKGKAFKLKAALKHGKQKVKRHRKVKYESSNTGIVTVNGNGKIKSISKGTAYVYAYAQNGVYARIKVTVK